MLTTVTKIKNELENIITFLESMMPLINSHMVDYFSKSSFTNNLPEGIKNDILNNSSSELINNILYDKVDINTTPHLYNYIENTKRLRLCNLKDVCLSKQELNTVLKKWGCDSYTSKKLEVYIKTKKSHEVEILSRVVAAISSYVGTTHLVDIGDGKGYLSSMLALHYKIPVLGIESSATKTDSAIKRVTQLKKIWKGLEVSPKKSLCSNNINEVANDLYKQSTEFVTDYTDINSLLYNAFSENVEKFGLVGLHTCGDLGATSIKAFNKNRSAKTICNISCCYHLLSEQVYEHVEGIYGFPLSNFLQKRRYNIGPTALMLASQAIDRMLYNKGIPKNTIFYRALLEVILIKYNCNVKHKPIGKFRKNFDNFTDYAQCALKNVGLAGTVSNEELTHVFNLYKDYENHLNIFHLLRTMVAPVIESLLLLDRLLFLHENQCGNSILVQLFDPVVSPRCYGLIAIKN